MRVDILTEDEFQPSTITIAGNFNISLDINNLSLWLPICNIFNEEGKRVLLISGSRESIKYFGPEGVIVSMCYKKTRRGMRTGAMNNMISADMQYHQKNIHLKISSTSITSVGTKSIENGKEVFKAMTDHINNLRDRLEIINNIDLETKKINLEWLKNNLNTKKEIEDKMKDNKQLNKEFLNFCLLFIEDDNNYSNYIEKMFKLLQPVIICHDNLYCNNFTIYNSVYHISPLNKKNFRMPLHRLAPYLASRGVAVEYHNWTSEGVNICFDIEEKKEGINHSNKEYKHRFSIHETTKIRQCSPTNKKEAYGNYLGVMKLLQDFFDHPDVDFSRYICKNFGEKKILEDYLLLNN
jgi:hypothetical protein